MIGYKIMKVSDNGNQFISGANSVLGFPAQLGIVSMPGNGIYMSNSKEYVIDYYSGLNDNEALITFEFDENDIVFGNTTDRESEFSVRNAEIIDIKLLDESYNYDLKAMSSTKIGDVGICSSYSDGKCMDLSDKSCDMCASEYVNIPS